MRHTNSSLLSSAIRRSRKRWRTPPARRFTPPSRRSGSTGNHGPPAPRPEPPCSSTSRAGTTPAAGTPRSATSPRPSSNDTTPGSPNRGSRRRFGQRIGRGHLAEGLRRAYNASRLDGRRRFGCPRPDLSRERRHCSNGPRSGRDERESKDDRQRVASPTGSTGADSLIQTSTTQARRVVQTGGGPVFTPLVSAPG